MKKTMTKEDVRLIASIAWKGAANAHRNYPENKHTFSSYWASAESQYNDFFPTEAEEPAAWTNEDIDAAYLLGLINSDSTNTIDKTAQEIDRLKGLGFNRPYQALMEIRYAGQEPRADHRALLEEAVKLLKESLVSFEALNPKSKMSNQIRSFLEANNTIPKSK